LREEEDPKKIAKAAKQFIKDMANEIFGEDVDVLEERITKKAKHRYYELIASLDEDENGNHEKLRIICIVKKIMERHYNKPLQEKIEILEKLIAHKKRGIYTKQISSLDRANSNGILFNIKLIYS
jgi:hypothetical protein